MYEVTDILRTVDPTITDDFVKSKLEGDSRYSVIKTNVTPEIYNRIDALGAPFLFGEVISERLYPDGPVGGSVVGRYRIVDEAVEGKENETVERNLSVGIERTFEKELAGVNGKRVYEIGADGVRIPVTQEQVSESVNGKTVRLTLNRGYPVLRPAGYESPCRRTQSRMGMRHCDGCTRRLNPGTC